MISLQIPTLNQDNNEKKEEKPLENLFIFLSLRILKKKSYTVQEISQSTNDPRLDWLPNDVTINITEFEIQHIAFMKDTLICISINSFLCILSDNKNISSIR